MPQCDSTCNAPWGLGSCYGGVNSCGLGSMYGSGGWSGGWSGLGGLSSGWSGLGSMSGGWSGLGGLSSGWSGLGSMSGGWSGANVACTGQLPGTEVVIQPPPSVVTIPGPVLSAPSEPAIVAQNTPCATGYSGLGSQALSPLYSGGAWGGYGRLGYGGWRRYGRRYSGSGYGSWAPCSPCGPC